jgi:hypothetical protein
VSRHAHTDSGLIHVPAFIIGQAQSLKAIQRQNSFVNI